MSNVNNLYTLPHAISFSSDVQGPGATSGALSPETLLLYCTSRLNALQANIDQFFAEQQLTNKKSAELNKVLELARQNGEQYESQISQPLAGETRDAIAARANALVDLYRTLDTAEAKQACAKEFETLTGMSIHDFTPPFTKPIDGSRIMLNAGAIPDQNPVQVQERLQNIKDTISGLSKEGELNMIQLQAFVSQRQLAIQLTTQLMQTINESRKGIIGNIGR